jgi:hypothetical protein
MGGIATLKFNFSFLTFVDISDVDLIFPTSLSLLAIALNVPTNTMPTKEYDMVTWAIILFYI